MKKWSKMTFSSIIGLTILATVNPSAFAISNNKNDTIDMKVTQKSDAVKALKELPKSQNVKNNYQDYAVIDVKQDSKGFKHFTLQPEVDGVYAPDKEVKVHADKSGDVVLVNGDTDAKKVKPTNKVTLDKTTAINKAFDAVHIDKNKAHNMKDNVVKKDKVEIDGNKNKYVYNIEIVTVSPKISHWQVKVDAQTGGIVDKTNLISEAATTGKGRGVLGDTKDININSIENGFSLEDLTHQGKLSAYNFNEQTSQVSLITNPDQNFMKDNQRAGVDANYYAKDVYNYYKNTFGRESYDDQGSPIVSLTHVNYFDGQDNRNNAAWIGDKMIYGDGDGKEFTGLAGANDVVAHEITHGVTQETAGLVYKDQSGALNESFSDVFGYFVDDEDFLMGEDVYTPDKKGDALRSMSDPEQYGQPANMRDYVHTESDNGGVHTNSGIPNKAAYNVIKSIGKDKSQHIYYRALTEYLTENATFADAKEAIYQSALDLYGEQTAEDVWESWNQVGV
ncbi:peptidase M4 family protein [Staphylococcus simiae]|nr:M4 family metallopeptidase [Staphylococcus simiae]MBO1199012.1 peptidase M4 family protein [Staphylococcus simiae]MBO1201280.1 peptidase M4 family protein [Staphylococcus simiae]MBO1203476.1 peptidase M4 family protein [Staphylococcus simiae]MBO1211004.1 peptidase M4 family protein [Staphylococcus simiae]MBO1229618.1 peptidase M4 family protein [Staphylococcus simiae]